MSGICAKRDTTGAHGLGSLHPMLILVSALLLIAVSCSGTTTNAGSSGLRAAEPQDVVDLAPAVVPESERVATLRIAAWKGNDLEPAGLPELIAAFEAENPGVVVELTYASRLDMPIVLQRLFEAGQSPDVIMADVQLVAELRGQTPPREMIDLGFDREWYGRISPSLQNALTTEDGIQIMPVEVIGMGNFVNMSLLESVGLIGAPTTIDDLLDACRRLDQAGIAPLVFTGTFQASLFVIANGLQDSDVPAPEFGSGEHVFVGDPSFEQSLDVIQELIRARCFDPAEQASLDPWSTALTAFKDGQVAMMPQGAWNIAAFDDVDGLDYVFAPIPSHNPLGVTVDLFGMGWSIPADAENTELARSFIDWFALPLQVQMVLEAEAAYTPFDDGSTGTPRSAAPFDRSRAEGEPVNFPFALNQWPGGLEREAWASMTALLLDPAIPNAKVLERWDDAVAAEQAGG